MDSLSDKQLENLFRGSNAARPRTLFRLKLRARLFVHSFTTDLWTSVLPQTLSYATAAVSVIAVFVGSVFAYDNPQVNASSFLYPLKQVGESVELALRADSPEETTEAHLQLAQRRREELRVLRDQVGQGSTDQKAIEKTLTAYVSSTQQALEAAQESESPRLHSRVTRVAAQEAKELKNIQEQLTPEDTDTAPALQIVSEVVVDTTTPNASSSNTMVSGTGSTVALLAQPLPPEIQLIQDAAHALETIAEQKSSNDSTIVSPQNVPVVRGN